ncbi:MAG: hypothetical protein HGA53_09800, partial [Anaerolineaceae bacterium]|nr:hypothetical protein [Anaerolineaceae bacterium]
FLNTQVSWDSEFYLSIAVKGYDDPQVRVLGFSLPYRSAPSLNYAFFPLYPLTMRIFAFPLKMLGMTPIATATLAGVIVSLLGALAAMLGLYYLTRHDLGEEGAVRAGFYLLIFPSGFFLAQIYTEGLFLGLTFATLGLIHHRRWLPAAILAVLAVWTRPGGVLLVIPLVWAWFVQRSWQGNGWKISLARALAALAPVFSFGIWKLSPLSSPFTQVERDFFGRGALLLSRSFQAWSMGFKSIFGENSQTAVYYGLEFFASVLAIAACLLLLKKRTDLALYGLAVIVLAMTSGSPQGMIRYVLAVPCIFYLLAGWGRRPWFDRAWTIASVLLMGLLATLFSFDFWVA